MRKLVASLACRNESSRLYGKPLQALDVEKGITILDYMLNSLSTYGIVNEIVLAISNTLHNEGYVKICKLRNIKYILGDEFDVLGRLIQATESVNGTDIFRLTSESPYTHFEALDKAWLNHVRNGNDLTALDGLPDGSGFEIIKLEAYKKSWRNGKPKHRSELCSLYIRENKDKFKIETIDVDDCLKRLDLRLTVDNPEDLVLCRYVYEKLKSKAPRIPVNEIIKLLDESPEIKKLVDKYIETGLKTMYL